MKFTLLEAITNATTQEIEQKAYALVKRNEVGLIFNKEPIQCSISYNKNYTYILTIKYTNAFALSSNKEDQEQRFKYDWAFINLLMQNNASDVTNISNVKDPTTTIIGFNIASDQVYTIKIVINPRNKKKVIAIGNDGKHGNAPVVVPQMLLRHVGSSYDVYNLQHHYKNTGTKGKKALYYTYEGKIVPHREQETTTESLVENELDDRKKKHQKTNTKHAQGWFTSIGGNPEVEKDFFNRATTINTDVSYETSSNSGEFSGDAASSGSGMGESFNLTETGENFSRANLIKAIKDLGYNYKFDKYNDQQLYSILNRLENKNLQKEKELIDEVESTAKYYIDLKNQEDYEWIDSYNSYDIYLNTKTNDYKVDGVDILFPTEQEAIEYIEDMGDFQ